MASQAPIVDSKSCCGMLWGRLEPAHLKSQRGPAHTALLSWEEDLFL